MERFIEYADRRNPENAKRVLEEGKRIIALQEARKAAKQNAGKETKAKQNAGKETKAKQNAGKETKAKQNARKQKKDLTAYFAMLYNEIAMLEKE